MTHANKNATMILKFDGEIISKGRVFDTELLIEFSNKTYKIFNFLLKSYNFLFFFTIDNMLVEKVTIIYASLTKSNFQRLWDRHL